jgi:hypothetical protein
MKVGDTVSITAADGGVFDYNVGLLTNGHADYIASFYPYRLRSSVAALRS